MTRESRSVCNRGFFSAAAAVTLTVVGSTIATPASAAVDLTGKSINVAWLYPDATTTIAQQTVVVGPGIEITCPGGGVGTGLCTYFVDGAQINIGANTLSLTITSGNAAWNSAAFNGYRFSGLAAGGSVTGYSLSTNFSGLDASRVSFTSDSLSVNMQGIQPTAGQSFTISLVGGAVPEPATWAMMIVGFGAVGSAMRRRRQVARIRFA